MQCLVHTPLLRDIIITIIVQYIQSKKVGKRHCSRDRHCMSSREHTVGAKIIQVMVVDWCKVSAALYKNEYKLGFMH